MKHIILITLLSVFCVVSFSQTNDEIEKSSEKIDKKKAKLELKEEKKHQKLEKREERKNRPKEMITLMGKTNSHGGFAALGINYTEISNTNALCFNARGSWVIGHALAFGVGGTGFVSDYTYNDELKQNTNYQGGYGGIYFEPIILPRFPVHISIPLFLGVGGIAEVLDYTVYSDFETNLHVTSSFLIFEPGAELELNLFKHLRLAFGAYYRFPVTINFSNTILQAEKALEGLSLGVTFKLGKF